MAHWDNKSFDEQATKIAAAYWAGADQNGSTLNELVTKIARDNSLNPEQIRRLCRVANVRAFEQKFAAMNGGADRHVEFDVADAETVIQSLYKDAAPAGPVVKAASSYPDLPRQLKVASANYFDVREKTASVAAEPAERPLADAREYLRLSKVAAELDVHVKMAEHAWAAAMKEVVAMTKRVGWDHDAFEKNAVALYGWDVAPELNAVRAERKMAALPLTREKAATLVDRLIGVEDTASRRLKAAADARAEYVRVERARKHAHAQLAELRKRVANVGG